MKIDGLRVINNFIVDSMEEALLTALDGEKWITDLKRRVQHYGYRYNYTARTVDRSLYLGALPDWSNAVADKLSHEGFVSTPFDQLIVNEYMPGEGIAPHIDCVSCFEETILSLSLGSQAEMVFLGTNGGTVSPAGKATWLMGNGS